MNSYKFIVSGRVQGVFYRASVEENASKEGFNGYVKNLNDGRVEACVTCEEQDLQRFVKILQKGSMLSSVEKIERFSCDESFENGFAIRY